MGHTLLIQRAEPKAHTVCHENDSSARCAAGALECGSASYRFSPFTTVDDRKKKAVAGATALQGASRILMPSCELKAHDTRAQGNIQNLFFHILLMPKRKFWLKVFERRLSGLSPRAVSGWLIAPEGPGFVGAQRSGTQV